MNNLRNFIILMALMAAISCSSSSRKEAKDTDPDLTIQVTSPQFFEVRTYYCRPGKLDDLLKRFKDHTMELFEKQGMINLGYWVPMDNHENKLVYLMGYESPEHREKAWEAFVNDPEWEKVYEASRADGPIVDSVVSFYMHYTDYSPELKSEDAGPRIFSLRTYHTYSGKLDDLHARFRDHTREIFENNGFTNIAYFGLDSGHVESKNTLKYFITFPDTAARSASWKSFLEDPEWIETYENSIVDGPLVDSITDELLIPVEFSPLK